MRGVTQTLKLLVATALVALVPLAVTSAASAASVICANGKTAATEADCTQTCPNGKTIPESEDCAAAGGGNCSSISQCDLIKNWVNPLIAFLSAFVGIAVVASIVIGGIQYGSSAGDPSKTSAAKARIRNSLVALIVFIALLSILNFLIPGGIG